MNILDLFQSVGVSGLLDITFMSVVIYSILVWFKRTKTAFVVIGMFIIGTAYLIARQLDLLLTISVFQGFFAIIIIALVIIFQEEIRYFLEQVASHNIVIRLRGRHRTMEPSREVQSIVSSVTSLSEDKIGALMVVQGKDPVARHLEGGIDLGGAVSEPLLRSIFDTSSPSHDGAIVISGGVVAKFSCYLPLSKDLETLRKMGTRHAAALGLTELTDALCIAVSEKRGTISVARNGGIRPIKGAEELRTALDQFYGDTIPRPGTKRWKDFFKKNYREKAIAIIVTTFLWFFFVHESRIEYRTFAVPVSFENVSSQILVEKIIPPEIEVTFSGSRRSFYFVDEDRIKIRIKIFDGQTRSLKRTVSPSNIVFPEGLALENIQPNSVTIQVRPAPSSQ